MNNALGLAGIALGFGAKLVSQVLDWYLMPALFKVEDWSKPTFGNRMYALEQDTVQKQLEAAIKGKSAAQTEADIPAAPGVQPTSRALSVCCKNRASAVTSRIGTAPTIVGSVSMSRR